MSLDSLYIGKTSLASTHVKINLKLKIVQTTEK